MSAADSLPPKQMHALYADHHGWLCGWLRKKLGCAHHADDLAQDTFLRILGSQQKRPLSDLREPRAYLTTIARGLVIDFFRRSELERAYLADLAALPEALQPSPEEQLEALQMLQLADRLLQQMTVKTRQAWLLSRLDGMMHAEIAAELQVSVPRVRQYLANAAQKAYIARFGAPE